MPELPEVETVKIGLVETLVGKTVSSVEIRIPKIFSTDKSVINKFFIGQRIKSIKRRAKILIIYLSNSWALAVHLKMTGQLIIQKSNVGFVGGHPEEANKQPLPHKHTHVIIYFKEGEILYFNDLRKFGWMRLLSKGKNKKAKDKSKIKIENVQTIEDFFQDLNLGVEPLTKKFTINYLRNQLMQRKTSVKQVIMNQSIIAGIGNIYADEALFDAKILPKRTANSLSNQEIEQLYHSIQRVLKLGIKFGGTTFNSYRNVMGFSGRMRDYLKVYGRKGLPCLRCGDIVTKQKIGQRSVHYCVGCQR